MNHALRIERIAATNEDIRAPACNARDDTVAIIDFLPTTRDEIILFEGQTEADSFDFERRGIVGPARKITLRALKIAERKMQDIMAALRQFTREFDREGVAGIIVQ
ncbi:MAG: hypothetical protein WDN02_08210 [Methylovirgula sp.]|uniref:hypothetical protein n=1 Tax=Methylovirgula sp. TaxID=1978224 RepID=UPI0030766BA8